MKNKILIIVLAAVALCLGGCAKPSDIKITSADIVSLSPSGLKSVRGSFSIGIHNPTFKFRVCDVKGRVYHKGKPLADVSADDFEVNGKSDEKYGIEGRAVLCQGVSLLSVLSLARDLNPDDYTLDISAEIKAKGLRKHIERNNVPLSALLNETGTQKN